MLGMFFAIFWQCFLINFVSSVSRHPILIVVSYDAFKPDYFNTKTVPNMNRLRKAGAYADMVNVFPTKTFPNHHSISTGMYPETHGLLSNNYYDTITDSVVKMSYELFHYNEDIVPIWRRNEDAGDGRYSGVVMWPGGCFPYQGKNVTYCKDYVREFSFYSRMDLALSWIEDPKKPANLVMVYVQEPDGQGHAEGIESEGIGEVINGLDNLTLYLEEGLKKRKLTDKVSVIHLSDHGMVDVHGGDFINVTQFLTPGTYNTGGSSPVLLIYPEEGYEVEIYQKLKSASEKNGHFKVYKHHEMLERWHFKNNPRAPAILIHADLGYGFGDLLSTIKKYEDRLNRTLTNVSAFGVHGYDNNLKDMHAFFMARGPGIKKNHKVPPFNTVDLYNLFCEILKITPTKNNGTLPDVMEVVATKESGNGKYSLSSILIITAGGIFIALILIGCAAVITLMMIKRQQSITTTAALNKRFPQSFQSSIEAQHLLEAEET